MFRQSQGKLSTLLRGLQRWLVASSLIIIWWLLMVLLGLLYYLYLFGAPFLHVFHSGMQNFSVSALSLANIIVVATVPVRLSMSKGDQSLTSPYFLPQPDLRIVLILYAPVCGRSSLTG